MKKAILFFVEGESDKVYIASIFKNQFLLSENIILKIFALNGKGNIKEHKIKREIKKLDKNILLKIIIVFDTDDLILNKNKDLQNCQNIIKMTNKLGYEYIFFNKDIETILEIPKGENKIKTALNMSNKINYKLIKSKNKSNYIEAGTNLYEIFKKINDFIKK